MKLTVKAALAACILSLSAGVAAADVKGVWRTETNKDGNWALVKMGACGSKTCGTMIHTNAAKKDNVGKMIVKGMKSKGDGEYGGGKIYAPDDDDWYTSKMELMKDGRLKVSGCVLGGLVCRSQKWTRHRGPIPKG